MHKVPPILFLEVVRLRELPFWRCKTLGLLEEYRNDPAAVVTQPVEGRNDDPDLDAEGDDDKDEGGPTHEEDDHKKVGTYQHDGRTFEEALMDKIELIKAFRLKTKPKSVMGDCSTLSSRRAQDSCGL